MAVSVTLTILKFVIGYTSGSKALIADGLHSASNIVTAIAVLASQSFAKQKKSSRFVYGYGKAEFLAAGFVTTFVISGAVILIVVAIGHLLHDPSTAPHLTALLVAAISVGSTEMIFRLMRCVGTRLRSQVIMTAAWANRADCFSSIAVIVGVIGSRFDIPHLDPIAALAVVAIIIKVNLSMLIEAVKSLMDVSANHLYSDEIEYIVSTIQGVQGISELKTRQVGQHFWAEMNIHVEPLSNVRKAHLIRQVVRDTLLKKIRDLEMVTVNIKPVCTLEPNG
jgi:cation diffusion facilitator family transporter